MAITLKNIRIIHDVPVSVEADMAAGFACSAYPVSSRRDDGLIACAYRAGSAQHSSDGVGIVQTSTDNGRTWSPGVSVCDGRGLQPPESLISPQIVIPPDGSLLTFFPVIVTTHPDHDILDSEAGLAQQRRYYQSRSVDDGRTWTDLVQLTNMSGIKVGLSGRSFVLPSGELFLNTPHVDQEGTGVCGACFSDDHGVTFSPIRRVLTDPLGQVFYDEAYYTIFEDGQILALYWVWKRDRDNLQVFRIKETLPVHRSVSDDNGRTWSPPQPTEISGQVTCPLAIDSNTVIAASNDRDSNPGIRLWLSHDRGVTFDIADVVQMWDATQQRILGKPILVRQAGESSDQNHEMTSFSFGLPDLNDLGDGSYLLTYYATVENRRHIRACRFELT